MQNTRERILYEALRLFAADGYEAVSVRRIAGRIGISQSALYKHFSGKRDVFDSILARMAEQDRLRARAFSVPEGRFSEDAAAYRATALERVRAFSLAQFRYWTEDPFASAFRRMLTLEQYRSPEMSALYGQYLSDGVVGYLEDLFRGLAADGCGARQLALAYYAPLYLLMSLYDRAADPAAVTACAREHSMTYPLERREKD